MDKNYQKKKRTGNLPPKSKAGSKKNVPVLTERPATPWNPRVVFGIHAGIIVVFLFILRLNLMDLPLERDESAYAYLGQRAGEGLAPYRDFYEMKPPFLFYGYALLNAVFGYSAWGLRLIAWFLSLLICGGVYLIGRSLFGAKYGLLAALTMVLMSASPYVMMTFAESELLVMSLAIYGVWLLFSLLSQSSSSLQQERLRLIGAGFLIGSAVMAKQSAVFFLGFAAVALLLLAEGENMRARLGKLITRGLWFSLGAIAPVLVCLGMVWGFGVWEDFAFWNFEYPQLYTDGENVVSWQTLLRANFKQLIQGQIFLWVLGQNGRFAGLKNLSMPLGFVVLFIATGLSAPVLLQGESTSIMRKLFGSNPFVEDEIVARLIESEIKPNETLAVLGSEPQIYVYLKRKAPSRHFYTAFCRGSTALPAAGMTKHYRA
ncbi:MAG: glycosyltransferase family 39 protein [Haliscomenobacter sp.]|nr:glycosyltransferase family 39 protein [Haliscomenobacter sp.]MBK9487944.1 glycosyltransferase family 39 protein [Haliscomenobacter sp.]